MTDYTDMKKNKIIKNVSEICHWGKIEPGGIIHYKKGCEHFDREIVKEKPMNDLTDIEIKAAKNELVLLRKWLKGKEWNIKYNVLAYISDRIKILDNKV